MVQTIGGDDHARRCMEAVTRADSSDNAVSECTDALNYRRLTMYGARILLINRGVIYLRRQEGQAALADFDAVLARDPDNAEALLNRGSALIMLRQYGPAVSTLTQALGLGVMAPHKAYLNRGAAREALGDLRGAYEDYSTALEIQPNWDPAEAELARFARTRRDHLASVLNEEPTP